MIGNRIAESAITASLAPERFCSWGKRSIAGKERPNLPVAASIDLSSHFGSNKTGLL
jgi:hypothetical protein